MIQVGKNDYNQWEFPQIFYRGKPYIDFSTFVELSGEKKSTLHRKVLKLNGVQFFEYKNRKYYLLEWAMRVHQYFKEQGIK